LDVGKATKLLDSPEWGDLIAWQRLLHDFSDRFGDALTDDGTPEQQCNLYQCSSTVTRACPAANDVVRRELPMHARRGDPQEFTSHGSEAWDNAWDTAKAMALRHARTRMRKDQLPSQSTDSYIIEKDTPWCDMRRLDKDCGDIDFMDICVMPSMCEETYREQRAFMTRHRRANADES
jgi:hypothetical protein